MSLIFFACSSSKVPSSLGDSTLEIIVTKADADSYWSSRADTSFALRALLSYQELAQKDSESVDLGSKLSRAYYYCGQFLTDNSTKRDSLFMLGYEASQGILMRNQEYYNLLFSTGDEKMAIRGLDGEYLDILYWGMANYGRWLETKGPLVRLGQRDLIWTTLEHVHDLDSNFYYGAYYRYKGALLARDPESEGDSLEIRAAFETAIEIAPEYFGNYTFMARYYCPLVNDKDLFYQLLTQVITAETDQELPYFPENQHEKRLAEELMIQAEKENWFQL